MDISTLEDFLTYSINLMIMIIIVFITFDFILFLIDSWRQLNPSQPDFYASCSSTETAKTALAYQQVKDAIWEETDLLNS